jgi:hypothetical protein
VKFREELRIVNASLGQSKPVSHADLQQLIAAAVAREREACANVCDTHTIDDLLVGVGIAGSCATMIRARSNAI